MLNALLALLNSRALIRDKAGSSVPVSIHLSRLDASTNSGTEERAANFVVTAPECNKTVSSDITPPDAKVL